MGGGGEAVAKKEQAEGAIILQASVNAANKSILSMLMAKWRGTVFFTWFLPTGLMEFL